MAGEETFTEGEPVVASIAGKITCTHQGAIRLDVQLPGGRFYPMWFYPDLEHTKVERVEDIRPGDVFRDASGDIVQALDKPDEWLVMGSSTIFRSHEIPRPLTLVYREGE